MADGKVTIDVIANDGDLDRLDGKLKGIDTTGRKASGGIKDIAVSLGLVKLASAAINIVKSSIDGAIKRVDVLNNSTRVFANMGFSAKETEATMNNLKKSIQGLPTPLDEAVQGVQLIASSTNDLGKSEKIYAALNNGILGFGGSTEQVNNAVLQLSQAFSNGKVDATTWNSMLNSQLGPALGALAKKMGKTTGELKESLSSGQISVEEFQDALIDLNKNGGGGLKSLEKIAQDATAGIGTGFANMRTAVVRGIGNIIQKFDEISQKLTGKSIGQNITKLGDMIDKVFESIVKSMDSIIPTIQKVTSFIKDNATAFKILGGVAGITLVAILAFKSTIGVMNTVKNAITGVKTAFTLMKATMLANPFALAIAGIAALAAAFIYFYRTSEGFRKKVDEITAKVKEMAQTFLKSEGVSKLLSSAMKMISGIGEKVVAAFKKIVSAVTKTNKPLDVAGVAFKVLKGVALALLGPFGLVIKGFQLMAKALGKGDINKGIDTILKSVANLAEGIKKNAPLLGSSFGKALEGILTAIGKALPGIVKGGLQIVAGLISGIAQGLPQIALAAVQLITSFTTSMLVLIPTVVASATTLIVSFLNAITEGLPKLIIAGGELILAFLQGITEQLPNLIESAASLIMTWLTAITEQLPAIIQGGMDLLLAFLQGISENIGEVTNQAISIIVNFISSIAARMGDIVNVAVDLILNFANGLASRMSDIIKAGVDLVVSFVNGIANNIGKVIDAGVNLIIKFLQGIGNRIADIVRAGMDLVDKMVEGVLKAQDRLYKAAVNLVNGMADNIRNNSGKMKEAGQNLLDALIGALPGGALIQNGLALASGLLDGLKQGFENVKSTVSGWATWIKDNKGPISYDKKLLIENGQAIVHGLNKGLENSFNNVKNTIFNLTDTIGETVRNGIESQSLTNLLADHFNRKLSLDVEVNFESNTNHLNLPQAKAFGVIKLPSITAESALGLIGGYGMSSSITNNYNSSHTSNNQDNQKPIYIENVLQVDGREIARSTSEYMEKELNRSRVREGRQRGLFL